MKNLLLLFILSFALVGFAPLSTLAQDSNLESSENETQDPFAEIEAQDNRNASVEEQAMALAFLKKSLAALEDMLEDVYRGFSEYATMILYLMITLTLIVYFSSMALGKSPPVWEMIKLVVMTMFVKHFIINWDLFEWWVYKPVMGLMTGIPSLIVSIASDIKPQNGGDHLEALFRTIDQIVGKVLAAGNQMVDASGWFNSFMNSLYAILLILIFFILQVLVAYVFVLAFISIHFLMAALPFALALSVFPKTKKYLGNIVHNSAMFLVTPAMASLAVALIIYFIGDTPDKLFDLTKTQELGSYTWTVIQTLMFGVISILIVLKSTSFAAQIVGTADTGFGQAYGALLGAGAAAFKITQSKSEAGGGGAVRGITGQSYNSASGVSGAVGFGAGKAANYGGTKLYGAGKSAYGALKNRLGGSSD